MWDFPGTLHGLCSGSNVADLRPGTSLRVEQEIPASDPLWADLDLVFGGPVRVELVLTRTAAGEVLARGVLAATAVHGCRRCLERVEQPLRLAIELLWATAGWVRERAGRGRRRSSP